MKRIQEWLRKPIVYIVLIGLTASLLVSYFISLQQKELIAEQKQKELSAIAKLKVSQIIAWREERLFDGDQIASNPSLYLPIEELLSGKRSPEITEAVKSSINNITKHYKYKNVLVVDDRGIVLASNLNGAKASDYKLTQIKLALEKQAPMLSDLHNNNDNDIFLDLIIPAKKLGVIILQHDPSLDLFPLIQSWPTASYSAETLLVRKDGDFVLFLNELRHRKGTALKLRFPLSRTEIPAVEAVLGKVGLFKGVDYRKAEVVSVINKIPDSTWYLIAKVDSQEIFTSVSISVIFTTALFVVSIILVSLLLLFLAQRQIELTLFKEREQFLTTIKSIGDGVVVTDCNGTVTLINRAAEKLTGWKENEASGKKIDEVMQIKHEVTGEKVPNPIFEAIEKSKVVLLSNDAVLFAKNGKKHVIEDSAAPINNQQGLIDGAVLVFRDVSEKKANENRIQKLSTGIEQSPVSIVITDLDGNIQYVNPKFSELTGYTSDEAFGKNPRILKTDKYDKAFYKTLWDTIKSGKIWHGEFLNKKKNGELYWESASISPILDKSNNIINFIAVKEDITEKKASEKRVRESMELDKERLQVVLDLAAKQGITEQEISDLSLEEAVKITKSKVGYLHFFNEDQKTIKLFSWSIETMKNCTAEKDQHYPLEKAGIWADSARLRKAVIHNDYPNAPDKKGYPQGHFPVTRHMSVPVFDGEKIAAIAGVGNKEEPYTEQDSVRLSLFMSTVWEIIKQKRSEQLLKDKNKELAELYAIKSEFTSSVSHELRSPLTAIKEGLSIVLDGTAGNINEQQKEFLSVAKKNVDRLHRLINDVLDFSKLEQGKMELKIQPNSIKDAIEETAKTQKTAIEGKGLKLITEVEENLPKINFDYDKIIEVLLNLTGNAQKNTDKGEIRVMAKKEGQNLVISITDTGIGIKADDLSKLFQDFKQIGGSAERAKGGTGLGLAISKKIIEMHKGKIWVESEFGKGSTFSFSLPL